MHVDAVNRDFNVSCRVDFRTVIKGDCPLVILDNVKHLSKNYNFKN